MKNIIFFCAIATILASCNKSNQSSPYTLSGTVDEAYTGKVYLQNYDDRKYTDIDSAEIKEGKFVFEHINPDSKVYFIAPEQKSKRTALFVDSVPLEINLSEEWDIVELTGSEDAKMLHHLMPKSRAGLLNTDSLVRANPESPVALYLLTRNIYRYNYEQLLDLYELVPEKLINHPYVKDIHNQVVQLEAIQPDKIAPEFKLESQSGDEVSLSSLRGNYVLIDFWASWCPDCRKASPLLVDLNRRYSNKNFRILGVSLDEEKDRWQQAIEKDGLAWQQLIVENGWNSPVVKQYALRWIPTSFLIDPEGKIITSVVKIEELEPLLKVIFH